MKKYTIIKMWKFVKRAFAVIATFFNLAYVNSPECISMNNEYPLI